MEIQPEAIWFLAGLLILILELAIPGGVLVFFGAAAWIVALAAYTGIAGSLASQLIIFAAASASLLAGLRKWIRQRFFSAHTRKT